MNTQTKKPAIKLNFFDFLLIFLIILVLAGAGFLIAAGAAKPADHTTIEYTVLVKELPEEIQIYAEPGQTVVDTVKLGTIGEVVSYEIVPATYDEYNLETMALVHGEYEDLISVYFTFRSEADKDADAYRIGNLDVAVGAQVFFRTPSFTGYGFVTNVTEQ